MRDLLVAAIVCSTCPAIAVAAFLDPLDVPAQASALAHRGVLNGIAIAGKRLVAVGQRGHVVCSDDGGATWVQSPAPVSVDLTAVAFASPERGWAVGHGGVVIATNDGGRSWAKKLDARDIARLLDTWYARSPGARTPAVLRQLAVLTTPRDVSLLDVAFDDARTGFAVGAFNLVLRTDDGGESWSPWLHATENPDGLHLYAIRHVAADVFIAGERGLVLKLNRATQRFEAVRIPYAGSFFGVAGNATQVVVHGLRGHAFRSRDGGARWEELRTGLAVALTGSTVMPDGRIVLVSQAGQVLVAATDGVRSAKVQRTLPAAAVMAAGANAVALVGPSGVRVEPLDGLLAGGARDGG